MGAFSFKLRFADPITVGLGRWENFDGIGLAVDSDGNRLRAKCQTIRKDRIDGRVCKPGEILSLYYAQRTKQCRLLGRARCTKVERIVIKVTDRWLSIRIGNRMTLAGSRLEEFARADGFNDSDDMHAFWFDEHGRGQFSGTVTYWEPL